MALVNILIGGCYCVYALQKKLFDRSLLEQLLISNFSTDIIILKLFVVLLNSSAVFLDFLNYSHYFQLTQQTK